MAHFRDSDILAVQQFLQALYACRRIERFAQTVITELPRLVGADQTTWNDIAPSIGRVQVMANPEAENHPARQAALARHIGEHPLMLHYWRTGDPSAVKVSDFMSESEFHRTALYDELYRELRYEDHFVMHLTRPGPTDLVAVLGRDERSFAERDRALLNLVRPHIAQAYRTARAFHRLRRRLEAHLAVMPRQARIRLGPDGMILSCPARAQRWLHVYFGDDLPRSPKRLPAALEQWAALWHRFPTGAGKPLQRRRATEVEAASQAPPPPFVRERGGCRLTMYADPASGREELTLYLEEQAMPATARARSCLGLTPREAEVLRHVERGLTNLEIAAALSLSESTVKRHLEHIFDKLGVHNRTAAAARLRTATDVGQDR